MGTIRPGWARGLLAAAFAACALALTACGDESEFERPAEFAAAADAICTDAAERTLDAFNETLPEAEADLGLSYFERLAEITADELDELEGLEPPEGLPGSFSGYLGQRRDAEAVLTTVREALEAGEQTGFDSAFASYEAIVSDAGDLGAEVGLGSCANILDRKNARAVTDVIEETAVSDDAERLCRDLATRSFQEQFGGLAECIENQSRAARAESVEVTEVSGVNGVRARAIATLTGNSFGSGRAFQIDLAFEDDGWRVQVVRPLS